MSRVPRNRAPRRRFSVAAILVVAVCGLSWLAGPAAPAIGQANTASVSVVVAYVNASGQTAQPPGGIMAGVSFTFTPVAAGQQAIVATTTASGQATAAVPAGTYTFQQSPPITGATLVQATIGQNGGQAQPIAVGTQIPLSPGATYQINATIQVSGQTTGGSATLTVFKTLTSPTGQTASGTLAGYSFTLAGQGGLPAQTQVTNQLGQAAFVNLAPGVYALSEAPATGAAFGSMTINGVSATQQQPFQIQAGGTYDVNVSNVVSGAGNITIQTLVVDQSGQPASGAGASLAGYSFSLTGQGVTLTAPTTIVSNAAGQATANLPPGAYAISETAPSGATLVGFTINGVPTQTGQFTVGVGQTTSIQATNRISASLLSTGSGARTLSLSSGCNNVASTFAEGTNGQAVATSVSPSTSVVSIWRFDNAAQVFRAAYFPSVAGGGAVPVDIPALGRLDAIYICVSSPATLSEPAA